MFKLTCNIVNILRRKNRSLSIVTLQKCSTSAIAAAKSDEIRDNQDQPTKEKFRKSQSTQNNIVAAAFAALKPNISGGDDIETPITDEKLSEATTVNQLLSISSGRGISRRHALKVVSTLAEWVSSKKIKLSDFENDARFLKLCRILTKSNSIDTTILSRSQDLSTVLNITADDEAARLVANLTLPQAVKVMVSLSQKKRRSISLLRSLSYNITGSSDVLNIKQSADLLYSMCNLNFPDDNLVEKICGDVVAELNKGVEKSSVVGSITTSLGLLKYRNPDTMDALCDWFLQQHSICRSYDIHTLFVTLATINYIPNNSEEIFKCLVPQLVASDTRKPLDWLNIVWSLLILKEATPSHVSSVLSEDFIEKIEGSTDLNLFPKLKLLNVNAAATRLLQNYSGPTLPSTSSISKLDLGRTKEKIIMVDSVVSALKNLIEGDNCLGVNINTGLGVSIDVQCLLDEKCNSLPLTQEDDDSGKLTKVAILAHDYHNICKGSKGVLIGANALAVRLLETLNYKVLNVLYNDFKPTDKLIYRVQYLENKLKEIVK